MKVSINSKLLYSKLSKIIKRGGATDSSLLIIVSKDRVVLAVSENDIIAYLVLPCKDSVDGKFIVNTRKFFGLIKVLDKENTDLILAAKKKVLYINARIPISTTEEGEVKETTLEKQYQFGNCDINFPRPDNNRFNHTFTIHGKILYEMLIKAGWAYAKKDDEDYQNINGVCLHVKQDSFHITTCDSRKLAYASTSVIFNEDIKVVLSNPIIKVLSDELKGIIKLSEKKKDPQPIPEVTVSLCETDVKFTILETNYVIKIMGNDYPDAYSTLPEIKYKVVIDKSKLLSPVVTLGPFTDQIRNALKLECIKGSKIGISSINISNREIVSREEIDFVWANDDFKIGFRATLMAEILKHISGDYIELDFVGENKAFYIKEPGNESDFFILQASITDL